MLDALVQVPLDNGTDDATFHRLFKPIMDKVVQVFQPGAIVLQCGAPPPVCRSRFRFRFTGCSSPSWTGWSPHVRCAV